MKKKYKIYILINMLGSCLITTIIIVPPILQNKSNISKQWVIGAIAFVIFMIVGGSINRYIAKLSRRDPPEEHSGSGVNS